MYVSGLQFGGIPLAFFEQARAGVFRLAVSEPVLTEIDRILCLKFGWSGERVAEALGRLLVHGMHVDPAETLDVIPDDPDDNRILECAVAAQAGYIVSGDNHALRLDNFQGIRILKVADFMARLPTL